MPRLHHLDLTEPEVHAMVELGLPHDISPNSPMFFQLLNARLSQLAPASYSAFSHATLKLLAQWKNLTVPERLLIVDSPSRVSEFAAWILESLERQRGGGAVSPRDTTVSPRRGVGVVSLPKISVRAEIQSSHSPFTTRIISSPLSGPPSEPPWRLPLAALLTAEPPPARASPLMSRAASILLELPTPSLSPRQQEHPTPPTAPRG